MILNMDLSMTLNVTLTWLQIWPPCGPWPWDASGRSPPRFSNDVHFGPAHGYNRGLHMTPHVALIWPQMWSEQLPQCDSKCGRTNVALYESRFGLNNEPPSDEHPPDGHFMHIRKVRNISGIIFFFFACFLIIFDIVDPGIWIFISRG